MTISRRLFFAILAFLISLAGSTVHRAFTFEPINDTASPFCGGRALLEGEDPYDGRCVLEWKGLEYQALYPMTTILAVLPFIAFGVFGPIVLWSSMVAVLVYGLLEKGEYWRLLVLCSAPFFEAFRTFQWSPLITGILMVPALYPLALVKPNIGLPVMLANFSKRRMWAAGLFVLISLTADPQWIFKWLSQTGTFQGYMPILSLPISLLLLISLAFWNDRKGRFFS